MGAALPNPKSTMFSIKNFTTVGLAMFGAIPFFSSASASSVASAFETGAANDFILHAMERTRQAASAPSMAVAIVRDGQTIWSGAVGHSDMEAGVLATADTLYTLGSISKTVTAATMMSLWEDGAFGLDDPINDVLPRSITTPAAPRIPITYRHLLSHRSGLQDSSYYDTMLYSTGDFPLPLDLVVNHMLVPGGRLYHAQENYTGLAPGVGFEYSNVGYGLLGYLGERLVGSDFASISEARILKPLGMHGSGWKLADIDLGALATSYAQTRKSGSFDKLPHHGLGTYPDGSLRSSANELALLLNAFMTGGGGVLELTTVGMMQTPHSVIGDESFYGLGFEIHDLGGASLIGHNGSDPGTESFMYFIPELNTGVVMLTNVEMADTTAMFDLLFPLIEIGAGL